MSVVLSRMRWPSLAQDLAIMTVPGTPITDLSMIYGSYDLSEADLKEILTIPAFQEMFQKELENCKAQGSKAGVAYRFGTLSQSLSEHLFRAAMEGDLEAKDAIRLLELFLKASGLSETAAPAQVATQVNVGISLPLPHGLSNPKLDHLKELKGVTDV